MEFDSAGIPPIFRYRLRSGEISSLRQIAPMLICHLQTPLLPIAGALTFHRLEAGEDHRGANLYNLLP